MTDTQTDLAPSAVSLVIPCRPEYVALCRLVAGAVAIRDELDEEAVADVKVIVTEACNCLLALAGTSAPGDRPACTDGEESAQPPAGRFLRMEFDSRADSFVVSVFYPERRRLSEWVEGCDPTSEAGLGLTILKALAGEITEVDTPEGTVLRLTRPLPA